MGCSLKPRIHAYHVSSRLLFTFVVLAQFLLSMVYASPVATQFPAPNMDSMLLPQGGDEGHVQVRKLYNDCSQKFVRIRHRHRHSRRKSIIDANAKENDDGVHFRFVALNIIKDKELKMTIQSNDTGEYLCFNQAGKLVTKTNGRKKMMCHFTEIYENNHTVYRLAGGNHRYFLAFRPRSGKPFSGHEWQEKPKWRNCKNFVHIKVTSNGSDAGANPHPGDYVPFKTIKEKT